MIFSSAARLRTLMEMIYDGEMSQCTNCGEWTDNGEMHEVGDLLICDECLIREVELIKEGE